MIEIALAFVAGLLTAGAPCILPLLPILLGASTLEVTPGRRDQLIAPAASRQSDIMTFVILLTGEPSRLIRK